MSHAQNDFSRHPSILRSIIWSNQIQLWGVYDHNNCIECSLWLLLKLCSCLSNCISWELFCSIDIPQSPFASKKCLIWNFQVLQLLAFSLSMIHFSPTAVPAIFQLATATRRKYQLTSQQFTKWYFPKQKCKSLTKLQFLSQYWTHNLLAEYSTQQSSLVIDFDMIQQINNN